MMKTSHANKVFRHVVSDFRRKVAELVAESLHLSLTASEIDSFAWGTLCVLTATPGPMEGDDWRSILGRMIKRLREGDRTMLETYPDLRRVMEIRSPRPSVSSVPSVVEEAAHAG